MEKESLLLKKSI